MVTTGTLCPLILFWTLLIHLAFLPESVSPLSCYQCTNEKTNIHCVDDFNLQSCDKDTCQTITSYSGTTISQAKPPISPLIKYTNISGQTTTILVKNINISDVSEKLTILKSCTTNVSCHRQRQEYERSCNVEASDWVCVYCCHHDKCNIHIASGTTSPLSPKSALSLQILDYIFISLLIIPVSKCILAET